MHLTPMGKPPPLAVRLDKALPFRRCCMQRAVVSSVVDQPRPQHGETTMRAWHTQSPVRWYGQYRSVIVPQYRQKAIFGTLRKDIGKILRALCEHMGLALIEGHAMADHVPLCLRIPPKFSGANAVGRLQGKAAIRMQRAYLGRTRPFTGLHC
jgi:putative transposase